MMKTDDDWDEDEEGLQALTAKAFHGASLSISPVPAGDEAALTVSVSRNHDGYDITPGCSPLLLRQCRYRLFGDRLAVRPINIFGSRVIAICVVFSTPINGCPHRL